MNYQELLCENIKTLRLDKKLTQAKFAEILSLSVEAIRNIEHKKYTPSASTIDTICATFNISPVDLLIPKLTNEQKTVITAINEKIKDCKYQELVGINDMIDIIRSVYRHK